MGCAVRSADEAIVWGLHADDPESLERLMAVHRQDLVRYAEGILGGDGSGEDVVQETFFRLWLNRHELRPGGSLRAYLYTLTKHAAIDERRRNARRATAVNSAASPPTAPSPLDAAAASDLAHATNTAVSALPARRREAFVLARLGGLTHREIAASMGVSPQTVANQISAAMASLREDLERFEVRASGGARGRRPARPLRPNGSRSSAWRQAHGAGGAYGGKEV